MASYDHDRGGEAGRAATHTALRGGCRRLSARGLRRTSRLRAAGAHARRSDDRRKSDLLDWLGELFGRTCFGLPKRMRGSRCFDSGVRRTDRFLRCGTLLIIRLKRTPKKCVDSPMSMPWSIRRESATLLRVTRKQCTRSGHHTCRVPHRAGAALFPGGESRTVSDLMKVVRRDQALRKRFVVGYEPQHVSGFQ